MLQEYNADHHDKIRWRTCLPKGRRWCRAGAGVQEGGEHALRGVTWRTCLSLICLNPTREAGDSSAGVGRVWGFVGIACV